MRIYSPLAFLLLVLLLPGCVSYESLLNFNQAPRIPLEPQAIINYAPIKIQPNDILSIQVSSSDVAATQPFNISGGQGGEGADADEFLVNSEGFIDFPTIGKIEVKGLGLEAVKEKLTGLLAPYFQQEPILQVRLANFRVNVNGEVSRPGSFGVQNDRVTILEAMTMAGDFTSYSRRDSILVIREHDGMRSFGYVDFNSYELFSSPYFYLQQNDVVYVQPNKTKVNSVRDPASRFLPWISAVVSLAALVITINK